MATDYGTDLSAVDALPTSGVLASGNTLCAQSLARQLVTDTGALEEVGDPGPYDSIDLRAYLGSAIDETRRREIESTCVQVLNSNPRATSIRVSVAWTQGALAVTVRGLGADGPFGFVLSVDAVSSVVLQQVA